MISTFVIYGVMVIAAGIAIAVIVKIIKRVQTKAVAAGVVVSDGVSANEISIITKLIHEELRENAELEALRNLKRVVDKAVAVKKVV